MENPLRIVNTSNVEPESVSSALASLARKIQRGAILSGSSNIQKRFCGTPKESEEILIQVFQYFGWDKITSLEKWTTKRDTVWTNDKEGNQVECDYTVHSLKSWKFYIQRKNEKMIIKFKDKMYFFIYYTLDHLSATFIWFVDNDGHRHTSFQCNEPLIFNQFSKWFGFKPNSKPIQDQFEYTIQSLKEECTNLFDYQFYDIAYDHLIFDMREYMYFYTPEWMQWIEKIHHDSKHHYLFPKRTPWICLQTNNYNEKNENVCSIIYFNNEFELFRPFQLLGKKLNVSFMNQFMKIHEKDLPHLLLINEWILQALDSWYTKASYQKIYAGQLYEWMQAKCEKERIQIVDLESMIIFCLLCNYFFQSTSIQPKYLFSLGEKNQELNHLIRLYDKYQRQKTQVLSVDENSIWELIEIATQILNCFQSIIDDAKKWIPILFWKLNPPPIQTYNPFEFDSLKQIVKKIDQMFKCRSQLVLFETDISKELGFNGTSDTNDQYQIQHSNRFYPFALSDVLFLSQKWRRIIKYKNHCRVEYKLGFQIWGNAQFTSEKQTFEKSKIQSYSKETISQNNFEYHKIDGEGKNEHLVLLEGKAKSSIHGFDAYKLCKTTPSRDMKNGKLCVVVGRVPSHALVACDSKMSKIRVSEFIPKDIIELDVETKGNETEGYEFEVKSKDDIISKDITLNGKCFYCVENVSNQFAEPCGHEIGCISCTIQLFQLSGAKCPFCREKISNVKHKEPPVSSKRSLIHHEKAYSFISDQVQEYKVGVPIVIKDFDPKLSTVCTNGIHCHKNLSEIYEWIPFGMIPSELVHEQIFDSKNLLSDEMVEKWTGEVLQTE